MSEPLDHPDDLPASDDPFDVLGISADEADERALKRAYVALIKRYRPDRAPDEFMRIRRAYEQAIAHLRWFTLDEEAPEARSAPRALERLADSGWASEVREALDGQDVSEALDGLARAVAEKREGAAELIIEWLDDAQVGRIASRPELGWENLSAQDNRWAALTVLGRRFDHMILADDARVLAEIDTLEFRRDLLAEPALEVLALNVLVRAAWEGDHRVPRLFGMLSDPTAGQASYRHSCVEDAIELAESWQAFNRSWRFPPSLRRAFMMFDSVEHGGKTKLLGDLGADMDRHPEAVLRSLDALYSFDQRLAEHFFEAVDELNYDEEEELDQLADERQEQIADAMKQADLNLRRGTGQAKTWAAATAGAIAFCVAFPSSVGIAAATGLLLTVGFWQVLPEYESYYRNARPLICQIVAETGVSPDHLLEWIASHSRLWNRLRFETAYEGDLPLKLFGDLARLRIAWRASDS